MSDQDQPGSPFREEALRHSARGRTEAAVLRLSPTWTRWTYWLLVVAFASALLYASIGTVHEYASGPAVVWMSDRRDVTATVTGTVRSVEVKPAQTVEEGAVLVRLNDEREAADLERIEREFELQLVKALRDPGDPAAREALTLLRTQKDVALSRRDQLTVRAPRAGVVGDVRIRPGQLLQAGDVAFTLMSPEGHAAILAMIPGQYWPQLRQGMLARFEVTGYRYSYQEMTVESVGAQIIGPNEVQRYLGQEIADTVKLNGPVVLVEVRPKSPRFLVDGREFDFHHGMIGTAELQVRTERIALAVAPGLRWIVDDLGRWFR
jgi:membrane fusion protein (multidrug efflux system)